MSSVGVPCGGVAAKETDETDADDWSFSEPDESLNLNPPLLLEATSAASASFSPGCTWFSQRRLEPADGIDEVGEAPAAGGCQPGGAATSTMLLHFGQLRICPIAAASRTFSRALQVGQTMEKGSTIVERR